MTMIERIRAILRARATVAKPGDGQGPQVLPGAPTPPKKVSEDFTGPQINGGPNQPPPLSSFPRQRVLGNIARMERPISSRPFGVARDDNLF